METELRRLDDRLRILWNPRAVMTTRGTFDAVGHSSEPKYDGRWQVERIPGEGQLMNSIVYVVRTQYTEEYRPIGFWLVEFFKKWDSAQVDFLETMRKEWQHHDDVVDAAGKISDERGATQFLEEQWTQLGGKHFIGRGFNAASK